MKKNGEMHYEKGRVSSGVLHMASREYHFRPLSGFISPFAVILLENKEKTEAIRIYEIYCNNISSC